MAILKCTICGSEIPSNAVFRPDSGEYVLSLYEEAKPVYGVLAGFSCACVNLP